MPRINGILLPDEFMIDGALIVDANSSGFSVAVNINDDRSGLITALLRHVDSDRVDVPIRRTRDTVATIYCAYGRGLNESRMTAAIGSVWSLRCRVCSIIDQKKYNRRVRIFAYEREPTDDPSIVLSQSTTHTIMNKHTQGE